MLDSESRRPVIARMCAEADAVPSTSANFWIHANSFLVLVIGKSALSSAPNVAPVLNLVTMEGSRWDSLLVDIRVCLGIAIGRLLIFLLVVLVSTPSAAGQTTSDNTSSLPGTPSRQAPPGPQGATSLPDVGTGVTPRGQLSAWEDLPVGIFRSRGRRQEDVRPGETYLVVGARTIPSMFVGYERHYLRIRTIGNDRYICAQKDCLVFLWRQRYFKNSQPNLLPIPIRIEVL